MSSTYGENLKALRKSKNLTQQQLADEIGVSVMTIRRYESGKTKPSTDVLSKIVEVLLNAESVDEGILKLIDFEIGLKEPDWGMVRDGLDGIKKIKHIPIFDSANDNQIIELLPELDDTQKRLVIELIKGLLHKQNDEKTE